MRGRAVAGAAAGAVTGGWRAVAVGRAGGWKAVSMAVEAVGGRFQ